MNKYQLKTIVMGLILMGIALIPTAIAFFIEPQKETLFAVFTISFLLNLAGYTFASVIKIQEDLKKEETNA